METSCCTGMPSTLAASLATSAMPWDTFGSDMNMLPPGVQFRLSRTSPAWNLWSSHKRAAHQVLPSAYHRVIWAGGASWTVCVLIVCTAECADAQTYTFV